MLRRRTSKLGLKRARKIKHVRQALRERDNRSKYEREVPRELHFIPPCRRPPDTELGVSPANAAAAPPGAGEVSHDGAHFEELFVRNAGLALVLALYHA